MFVDWILPFFRPRVTGAKPHLHLRTNDDESHQRRWGLSVIASFVLVWGRQPENYRLIREHDDACPTTRTSVLYNYVVSERPVSWN